MSLIRRLLRLLARRAARDAAPTRFVRESKTYRCPFCVGTFSAGWADDKHPAILHSVPFCSEFTTHDAPEFLDRAFRAMVGK